VRVLVVVSEVPPIVSGVARCADRLVGGLTAAGHDVDVISSLEIPRWEVGEFRLSSFAGHWPFVRRRLGGYDVVNLHGPVPTMSDVFLAMTRYLPPLRRPRLVYTHHSAIELERWARASRAYSRVHDRLAQVADRIVTTSEFYRQLLARHDGPPVEVVPWAVDYGRFALPRRAARPPGAPLRLLFVGQMRPYKGVDVLLDAVAGHPRLRLSMVGQGPLEARYRQHARRLGASNAEFLGRVDDDHLAALYGDHDVVVLPSTTRSEAFGLVLLEGMAAGCVPVASDLPGVRDIARPTGMLVPPGDHSALRQALTRLADDPDHTLQLARASQARARQMGWDGVVASYERIFTQTLREWRDRRAARALPQPFTPPEPSLAMLAERFGASWASLLVFDRSPQANLWTGWGRADPDELRRGGPRIAQYVARTGRPLLLDPEAAPAPVRWWLVHDDVASALSAPVVVGTRLRGALSLAIGSGEGHRYAEQDLKALVSSLQGWTAGHRGQLRAG
jgi:glycosyltransferase involved in cell wall biosynthesis